MDTMEEHISAPILKNRVKQEVLNEIDEENKFDNHYLKSFKSLSRSRSMSVERSKEVQVNKIQSSRWTPITRSIFIIFTLSAMALRLFRISEPRQVVFDEVHFGGFASHYLKGTYFFDVHPPLGKLIIAGIGHLYNYKGTFAFKDIGDPYESDPSVPFVQMRTALASFSIGSVMFAMAILVEMGFSPYALTLAGILLAFDNGLITQSRYILLDGMMIFFIFGTLFFWVKFRQFRYKPFSTSWWTFLTLTGVFIAGTVGVKLVGLFTVALVACACFYDLWELSDWKRQMSDKVLLKHFFSRFMTLAVLPFMLYLSFYYVHFKLLPNSGPGDGHMSVEFQKTLLGNKMHSDVRPAYYGQSFRISNRGEKIYLHSHLDRIPLNHIDGKVSSQGQQVNGYPIEDENNIWEILLVKAFKKQEEKESKKLEAEDISEEAGIETEILGSKSPSERIPIRFGDEVQICHKSTRKCMLTHDVASPLTRTNMEVTMYEAPGSTDENSSNPRSTVTNDQETFTHWIIQPDNGDDSQLGQEIKSLGSSFNIFNKEFKVKLLNYGKNLPPWGFGQRELNGCRKAGSEGDLMYSWMISDILEERTAEEEAAREIALKETKPMNFLKKFKELQVYSILANSGLIDEHPFKSRPHEWILPSKGLGFWNDGTRARIFMMGNFVAWTLGTFGVFLVCFRFPKDKFLEHRGSVRFNQDHFFKRYSHKIVYLFGAYLLHYLPFYLMGRSLYLHHYLPAYMFSVLITAAQFDCMTREKSSKVKMILLSIVFVATLGALVYLLPLVYGLEIEAEILAKLLITLLHPPIPNSFQHTSKPPNPSIMHDLQVFLDSPVMILTNDGRILVGLLNGYDQATNLILTNCHERIFSLESGVSIVQLGLYIVRGDNIAIVGDINEEIESKIDYENLKAEPIRPIIH